jgi:hypothetical protein
MKKTIALLAVTAAVTLSVSAQGLVNFNNSSAAGTKISTNTVVGGAATGLAVINTGSANFYYALFDSLSATTVGGSSSAVTGITGSCLLFLFAGSAVVLLHTTYSNCIYYDTSIYM